jgi:hypothetical protein
MVSSTEYEGAMKQSILGIIFLIVTAGTEMHVEETKEALLLSAASMGLQSAMIANC